MTKTIRSLILLAAVFSLAGAVSFAQSGGEATYKAKCQMCHGATGVPSAGMAKMGAKAPTDPDIKKLTLDQLVAAAKASKIMAKPIASLTDAQIKEAVVYYRSLAK
jgi:mono/diheme cytochrome c family protein